jgi:hypothetical protein
LLNEGQNNMCKKLIDLMCSANQLNKAAKAAKEENIYIVIVLASRRINKIMCNLIFGLPMLW